MRQRKRRVHLIWIVSMCIICLIVGSAVAYAAMTVNEEKVNLFQIGNLQTRIDEVFTEPTQIQSNKPVEKKVTIVNTGTVDQFVRVMLHPEIQLENNGSNRLLPSKIGREVILDIDNTNWKLGEDGYYYYLNRLKPGNSNAAKNLFTQVKLTSELGQEYEQASFKLLVKVEAINCGKYAYRDAWWQGISVNTGTSQEIDKILDGKSS